MVAIFCAKCVKWSEISEGDRCLGCAGEAHAGVVLPDSGEPRKTFLLEWRDAFAIGEDSIDAQHRQLLAMINAIHQAARASTRDGNFVRELIHRLEEYAAHHFSEEEALLRGLADLDAHVAAHRKFQLWVQALRYSYENTIFDLNKPLMFLVRWFIDHTQKTDREAIGRARKSR